MNPTANSPNKIVLPIRMHDRDLEALRDRAAIEASTPTAIARDAIRFYLANTRPEDIAASAA
jgi:hypothetical protein